MKLHKKFLATGLAAVVLCSALLLTVVSKASAATYPYTPSDLISDSVFTNSSAMSASAIQTFLNNENSGLKGLSFTESCSPPTPKTPYGFTYYPHCGKKESAATIIYDAGKAYGINPRVIMATLQKEQSLITMPHSTNATYQAHLNCAMGYNSCSGFVGFFSQVDNGAWQFREYIESMSGKTWWGTNTYPCANSSSLYSTGLYPGRTVKFADPGGKAETITLADSATAALYCYTPYVGPLSTTGYSGSYNFVQSFEQWWGSTVYAYAGEVTVTTYSDSGYQNQLSLSAALASDKMFYVKISALNTGSKTWNSSFTRIATINPDNRSSGFANTSWLAKDRPTHLDQSSVAPGQTGTFEFSMTTPKTDGEFHEDFGLVADGQNSGWMKDTSTFGFDIHVSNPYNGSITQLSTYRDSSYSQPVDPSVMTYGEKVYVRLKVKNTGTQTWSNSFTKVATENPNNRTSVFSDSSWPETDRPAYLMESSVAPGQTGTFEFSLTAPSTDGTHSESFGLVADGQSGGWMPGPIFTDNIKVLDPPLGNLYTDQILYPGQSLEAENGYRLTMQGDGNLVLYTSAGKALWDTHTNGKGGYKLIMQGDGNLVLYTSAGKALWDTHTNGKGGYILDLQSDHNLVLYTKNSKALWNTRTNK